MSYAKLYTPKTLSEFVYPNSVVQQAVKNTVQFCLDRVDPSKPELAGLPTTPLLLHGPSGTGKTTLAKLIPNEIEGCKADIIYAQAADLNNADGLDKFSTAISLVSLTNRVINYGRIEELEQKLNTLSRFKEVLEDLSKFAQIIITTNHINRVDSSIQSRCKKVHVPPVTPDAFLPHAKSILARENLCLPDDKLLKLLESQCYPLLDIRKYYEVLGDLIAAKHC